MASQLKFLLPLSIFAVSFLDSGSVQQVLVAFFHSNGSLIAYPTQLDSYSPSMAPGDLTFPVSHVAAEYINKEMIIYATLSLPEAKSKFYHVWQAGSTVSADVPGVHPTSGENVLSKGTVEFQ